jgi:hypothetical protein
MSDGMIRPPRDAPQTIRRARHPCAWTDTIRIRTTPERVFGFFYNLDATFMGGITTIISSDGKKGAGCGKEWSCTSRSGPIRSEWSMIAKVERDDGYSVLS